MKKTTFLIALSIAFFACDKKQNTTNDLTKLNLHGAVKSVLEETFMLSEDLQKVAKTMDYGFDNLKTFDKDGFITQKLLFTPAGTSTGMYVYEYNNDYLLVRETKYTASNNIDRVFVYSYNKDNQLDTQTSYNALGMTEYVDKFSYPSPTLSVQESFDADGNLLYKWEYEYDANKNMTKKTWHAFGNVVFNTFIYNDKNQLTEQTEITEHGATTRWQYEYDENGNVISEICTYPDGVQIATTFKYEYDKQNNWIVKQIFGNDIPLYQVERTIEYY